MPIAFKEWAVTVRALAEGEQLVTLRKGGIREPERHFSLEYDRFFLYPTFDHQRPDLVRESHQPELSRALEEGVWTDGEALRIEVDDRNEQVHLFERARITRDKDVVNGEYIFLDQRTEFFSVHAAKGAAPTAPEGRVKVVIQPKNKPEAK